jgi:hypothetical protein
MINDRRKKATKDARVKHALAVGYRGEPAAPSALLLPD